VGLDRPTLQADPSGGITETGCASSSARI